MYEMEITKEAKFLEKTVCLENKVVIKFVFVLFDIVLIY